MPSPGVVDVVQNVWYYTKRPTNVYLVVDTSGSMEGTKIARAREALAAFVEPDSGDRDRVGTGRVWQRHQELPAAARDG